MKCLVLSLTFGAWISTCVIVGYTIGVKIGEILFD